MLGKMASKFANGFKIWANPNRGNLLRRQALVSAGMLGTAAGYSAITAGGDINVKRQNMKQRVIERRNRTLGDM